MPIYLMAGVWKKFNPEVLEGYVGACSLLEKGKARVQVLGDSTIRMVCYGGNAHILPPLYVTDVPDEWVDRFRRSRTDALDIIKDLSDKPSDFLAVYNDTATPEQKERVAKDVLEDWDQYATDKQDVRAFAMWKAAAVRLQSLVKSHFPKPKKG